MLEPVWNILAYAVGTIALISIPVGLVMALYTNDTTWLWLCAPLLLFLS